jgi:hypothetical protein
MKHLWLAVLVIAGGDPGSSAYAQWLDHPTVGIPRTPTGKPDLNAPPPKLSSGVPDLSGLWNQPLPSAYVMDITSDLPPEDVKGVASQLYRTRLAEFGKDDPGTIECLPAGPRHILGGPTVNSVRIVQTPLMLVMLFEDLTHRQIHLDGRTLPTDPNPSFMGYSVGRWDGDTLVVETVGFNGRTWLDLGGHPYGESLRVTERYRRVSFGRIERQITLVDEEFYNQPIVVQAPMQFAPDTDMLEYVCNENPRTRPHLVGRTEQERAITIPLEALRRYVGSFKHVSGRPSSFRQFTVTLYDGELFIALNGKGRIPLVPLSDTTFSARLTGTLEFVNDGSGRATYVISHAAEGVARFEPATPP